MHTPVPDAARPTTRERPPQRPAPTPQPTPSTRVHPPPVEDLASDAPVPLKPQASPPKPLSALGSDDDLIGELGADPESVSPDVPFPEYDEDEPEPLPPAWWHRWLRPPPLPPHGRTNSRLSRHLAYEVIVVIVTFLVASILLFTSFDGEMRDVYMKAGEFAGMYPRHSSGEVALVTVGEEALYLWEPGQRPPDVTPRALLGELVAVLDEAGAEVVVLDFLLDTVEPGDERLAEAAAAHGRVIAAERFVLTDPALGGRFAAGPAADLGTSLHTGFANLGEEALWTSAEERLVRSAHLVEVLDRARLQSPWPASVGQDQAEAEITPHMALLAAWQLRHPDEKPDALFARLAQGCESGVVPSCTLSLTDLDLPAGPPLTSHFDINFRGPEHVDGLSTLRASELLRLAGEPALYRMAGVDKPLDVPDWLREEVEGKLIVIGRVDDLASDRFATPYGFPLPVRPDMDGARVQAQLIDTLLTGRHVSHSPAWSMWLLAGLLVVPMWWTSRFLREDIHTFAWLAAAGLLVVGGAVLFLATDGVVLDLGVPLTVMLLGIVGLRLQGWAVD